MSATIIWYDTNRMTKRCEWYNIFFVCVSTQMKRYHEILLQPIPCHILKRILYDCTDAFLPRLCEAQNSRRVKLLHSINIIMDVSPIVSGCTVVARMCIVTNTLAITPSNTCVCISCKCVWCFAIPLFVLHRYSTKYR